MNGLWLAVAASSDCGLGDESGTEASNGEAHLLNLTAIMSILNGHRRAPTPYPLIDSDPHFARVVRYMRRNDYSVWAAGTVGFPVALRLWGAIIAF